MGACHTRPVVTPAPQASVAPISPSANGVAAKQQSYRVAIDPAKSDEPAKGSQPLLVNNLFISTTVPPADQQSSLPAPEPGRSPSSNPDVRAPAPQSLTGNPHSQAAVGRPIALQNSMIGSEAGASSAIGFKSPAPPGPDASLLSEPFSNLSGASHGSVSPTPPDRLERDGSDLRLDRTRSLNAVDLQRMMMKRQLSKHRVVDVDFAVAPSPSVAHTISGPITAEDIAAAGRSASSSMRRLTAGGERGKMAELITLRQRLRNDSPAHSGTSSPHRGSLVSRTPIDTASLPADFSSADFREQVRLRAMMKESKTEEKGKSLENMKSESFSKESPLNPAQPQLNRIRSTGRFYVSKRVYKPESAANSTPTSFNDETWASPDGLGPTQSGSLPLSHSSTFIGSTPDAAAEQRSHQSRSPPLNPRRATFAPNHSASVSQTTSEYDMAPMSQPGSRRSTAKRSRGRRQALILDSAQVSQQLNSVTLYKCGFQVTMADTLDAALQLVEEHHYDIILIDYSTVGSEACRAIRETEDRRGDVPAVIIAQISGTDPDAVTDCEASRFNGTIERGCAIGQAVPEILDLIAKENRFINLAKSKALPTNYNSMDVINPAFVSDSEKFSSSNGTSPESLQQTLQSTNPNESQTTAASPAATI